MTRIRLEVLGKPPATMDPLPNPSIITFDHIRQIIEDRFPNKPQMEWGRDGGRVAEVHIGAHKIKVSVTDDSKNFPALVGEAWLAVTEEIHNVEQVLLQFETRDLMALKDKIDWVIRGLKPPHDAFAGFPEPDSEEAMDQLAYGELHQSVSLQSVIPDLLDSILPPQNAPSLQSVTQGLLNGNLPPPSWGTKPKAPKPPPTKPITPEQVKAMLALGFPGLQVKETPRLDGVIMSVSIWQFTLEVSLTTTDSGADNKDGEAWVSLYLQDLVSPKNNLHSGLTCNLSTLQASVDWSVQYLTGVSAALEMAFEKPPEPVYGIYGQSVKIDFETDDGK